MSIDSLFETVSDDTHRLEKIKYVPYDTSSREVKMRFEASVHPGADEAVAVDNRNGAGPFVIVCDHASNTIPREFGGLGLGSSELSRHIAWDPGALGVAKQMSAGLDAPLVRSTASRLLIDCNRPLDAHDLITTLSEVTHIPGNAGLSEAQKQERIGRFYSPFHEAVQSVAMPRLTSGLRPGFIAVHSFNPTYRGVVRPWEIGLIFDEASEWALAMGQILREETGYTVGLNEPYSPKDRVYHTLNRHARGHGLPAVMIEVRNDEISTEIQQIQWGELLSRVAKTAFEALNGVGAGAMSVRA
jgi:predicted N-formylglutamate amidohydrolase